MKPGLYALASLDGGPLQPEHLAVLGLEEGASGRVCAQGIVLRAIEVEGHPKATDVHHANETLSVLSGFLEEPEALCRQLGLPEGTPPAGIAAAAVARWAHDAALAMLGEWTFLQWCADRRELQVWTSMAARDPVFHAVRRGTVAISAEQLRLGRLPWVGTAVDAPGLLNHLSLWTPSRELPRSTPWKNITRVAAATHERFRQAEHAVRFAVPGNEHPVWNGTFDDAVDALTATLRRILEGQARRHARSAFLLSGGIDSTLLTAFGSEQRGEHFSMFALCSAAPEQSHVRDEWAESTSVARYLGVDLFAVRPPAEASALLPPRRTFDWFEGPKIGPRFYLYEALYRAAWEHGAHTVVDGVGGENASNNKRPLPTPWSPVRAAKDIARSVRERVRDGSYPAQRFSPRFSKELLHLSPPTWTAEDRAEALRVADPKPGESRGEPLGVRRQSAVLTGTPFPVRLSMPYRDRRLYEIVSRLPASFDHQGGHTRSLGRAMLRDRVPEAIRLRTRSLPFSPDFNLRVQRDARAVLGRIAEYRGKGIDQWVDLPWLARALTSSALQQGRAQPRQMAQVLATCHLAEFLLWSMTRAS